MEKLPTYNQAELIEIFKRTKEWGRLGLVNDETTFNTDDPDCYPRGIIIELSKKNKKDWDLLNEVATEINGVSFSREAMRMWIKPDTEMNFRLTEFGYATAICSSLVEDGFNCYADVNWR